MTKKRLLSSILCPALVLSMTACSGTSSAAPEASASTPTTETTTEAPAAAAETASAETTAVEEETKAPKYVFLFIGDGMSYPQFQAASDYLGAVADTVIHTIVGSFGLVTVAPLTAITSGLLLTKRRRT